MQKSYRRLALALTIEGGMATPRSTRLASMVGPQRKTVEVLVYHDDFCREQISIRCKCMRTIGLQSVSKSVYPFYSYVRSVIVYSSQLTAFVSGHAEIVDLLMAAGADAKLADENDGTPLVSSPYNHHDDSQNSRWVHLSRVLTCNS